MLCNKIGSKHRNIVPGLDGNIYPSDTPIEVGIAGGIVAGHAEGVYEVAHAHTVSLLSLGRICRYSSLLWNLILVFHVELLPRIMMGMICRSAQIPHLKLVSATDVVLLVSSLRSDDSWEYTRQES